MVFVLSACVSSGNDGVLQSAIQPDNYVATSQNTEVSPLQVGSISNVEPVISQPPAISFASDETVTDQLEVIEPTPPPPPPRVKKTYLINGLASSVESIGYGFTNLSKKIPGASLHNYASFIESSTLVRSKVTREIIAAYKADPSVEINLVGISFGANIVTWIAEDLNRKDIPINYLATLEGPAMSRIHDNVRLADNFSCTGLNCFRTTSKLAWRNKTTEFSKFKVKTGHVALANHEDVHARILSQIDRPLVTEPESDPQLVAQ